MIKHALLSLIRTKGRTLLFTLLITTLTLVLTLGVSVWAAIEQFLSDADEFYTTVAQIEYIGKDYPTDTLTDPDFVEDLRSFDLDSILTDPAVLSWNPNLRTYAYVDGFRRDDLEMPNRGQTALVITGASYVGSYRAYQSRAVEVLYSRNIEDNDIVLLEKSFGHLDPHHYYLVIGHASKSRLPHEIVRPDPLKNEVAAAQGIELPTLLDITDPDGKSYTIPEVFRQVGTSMEVESNSLTLNGIESLQTFLPFHQAELYLLEGRDFSEDEIEQKKRVIVISEMLALQLNKRLGDTIEISISQPDSTGSKPSFWAGNGFLNQEEFTIVGISKSVTGYAWQAFVPSSLGLPYSNDPIGYSLGQLRLRNEQAVDFNLRHQPAMQGRFIMTTYDQGYATVAGPFRQILRIAQLLSIICGLVLIVVLIFFGYSFVYRQRETGRTMLMLGTERSQVGLYFLVSAGLIALVGALVGALIAYRLHDRVIEFVRQNASNQMLIDSRFSDGNLSIARTLEFAPRIGQDFFLYVGGAVMLFTLLWCFYFLIKALFEQPKIKQKRLPKKMKARTSRLGGGASKYAFLSMIRGGSRSLVVPLMAIVIVLFFGQLSTTSDRYRDELNQVYTNTQIRGRFTDFKGKRLDKQIISADQIFDLLQTKSVDQLALTQTLQSIFNGVPKLADGTIQDVKPIVPPSGNAYAIENFLNLFTQPGSGIQIIASNDIRHAPEFFYSGNLNIEFLPGYDESFLAKPTMEEEIRYQEVYVSRGSRAWIEQEMIIAHSDGIVSKELMDRLDVKLGDTIRLVFQVIPETTFLVDLDIHIVGSYGQQGNVERVYIPLSSAFDTRLIWGEGQSTQGTPLPMTMSEEDKETLADTSFESATFRVRDTSRLIDLKDYFTEQHYSQVNKVDRVRTFIVLSDAVFNNTVASIEQQIEYTDVLYPILVGLTILIAFVVSYLLTIARRVEMATMRGLGSPNHTIFGSFFIEQLLLSLFGMIVGIAGWTAWRGSLIPLHWGLIFLFIIAYLIGASISIGTALRQDLMSILGDRD